MATPLVPSDLLHVVLVCDPQIAPDGAVYYRRCWFDVENDEIASAIHRVARDGAERPFTAGTKNDRLPRVAPAGSALAFVTDRDEKARLHVLRLDGGEATALGEGWKKIVALAWSPD